MQPVLTIDLTKGVIGTYIITSEWEEDFLGGASLAARILFDQFTVDLDPFSPESSVLVLNGPLSGTAGPSVGRFVICGKSPLTGLWAESNCGGFWGAELRKTGFDGVWITGRSETPKYITIIDNKVEILDATSLWGLDSYQVQDAIKRNHPLSNLRVLGIGPAGEALIPYASILCDHGRVAGRTGLGAVWGSKNLKAIGVKGSGKIPVFDPPIFEQLRSEANHILKNDPLTRMFNELGTGGAAEYFNYLGEQPKLYFSTGELDGADNISGASLSDQILVGKSACHGCVIACGRVVKLEDGEKRKGPEYETLVGFGPNLGLTDMAVITRLGELCDRYGLDVISMSGTLGLALRLAELGIIKSSDAGGLDLSWGKSEVIEECVHLTVKRQGIGRLLALGSRKMAEYYSVPDEAIQVNGLELAYHDPRGASGMAIVYATSPRGACHNQSDYFMVDVGQADPSLNLSFFDRQAGAEKAANVALHQDFRTVNNSLVMCTFANVAPQVVVNLINAVNGYHWELADMIKCGERGWNLKRLINLKLGLHRENEKLPGSIMRPLTNGGAKGYIIPFDDMIKAYYEARDWNPETGYPNSEKLIQLGLNRLAKKNN